MSISNEDFSKIIEDFLSSSGISPSTFGKLTKKDPRFVFRVRNGMEVKECGKNKILEFIKNYTANDNEPQPSHDEA